MTIQHMTGEAIAEFFAGHLSRVDGDTQRAIALEVLEQVHEKYPELGVRIAWNQLMFMLGGTFIISFFYAKKHMAIVPERVGIKKFSDEFGAHGLPYGEMMVRFPWPKDGRAESMPLGLLAKMIEFSVESKRRMTEFWR